MSRSTDIIVTLLPDPDSPTIPRTSRGASVNETPSTALTTPSSVRNATLRSLTSSSGSAIYAGRIRGSSRAYRTSTSAFAIVMKNAP
jgi:hypothetical protein